MKKLILHSFFIALSVLLFMVPPTLAADELWSRGTNEYKVQREGNSIVLTNTNPKVPRTAGIPSLIGTINGTTFTGKQYLLADSCPNFEGYVPASGTVSADGSSISVSFTSSEYYTSSCTIKRNFEDSYTYTKIGQETTPTASVPTMKPSPTPTETPLNLNGTWAVVNEFGTSFTFSGHHTGDSLTLQITDASDVKDSIGKTSLSGTLSGHSFSGTQILIPYEQKCLGKYFNSDATGTVAADGSSITIDFTNLKYNPETCAKIPGTEFSGSITYVRKNTEQKPTQDKDIQQESPSPEVTSATEKPSVGVSSKDFRELVRINAEYQKAKAELEEIKKANDPRYEAKKDFPVEYNAALKGDEKRKGDLSPLRADLETVHELFSKTNDFIEIEETIESIKKGETGEYGKMDLFTDAVNSFNAYHDLRNKGASEKDATTKSILDNFGTSALTLIPVLNAIDLVATTPDFILEIFGVDEGNWSRKYVTDGFIGKFAPSGVVEQTTDLMIEDDWADIGNALAFGWGKVQSAEGMVDTTYEASKLLAGTIGAVPVAIAQGVSDIVGGGIYIGEKAVDFVSSWFTYPN